MTELSENCASYPAGTLIWIADADVVWKKAEVVETAASGQITVLVVETGQTTSIKKTDLTHLCNPDIFSSDGIVGLEDLTELVHLHEASILDSLNIRFDVDHIYTFTGPIVIAVNPFKSIPALYDTKCMETFLSPSPNRVPHVFFSAATAYRGLCKTKISQTVLISGESGAGKTESTKFVMRLLAIAGSENADKPSQIERQILQSNPLLEALGNAKTNRNDNSSRFGKFIEMQFSLVPCPGQEDPAGRLAGAMIHTYLLETVRVCHQLEGERNYHSFYQICAAAAASSATGGIYRFPQMESSSSSAAQICNVEFDFSLLGPYSDFRYLTGSSCHSLKGVNDLQEFESTVCAMQTIGIPHGDQVSLFNLIGGVLHLGNIKFENPQGNSEASVVCSESRKSSLALASSLLKLSPELLEECLTLRSISTRDGEIKIPLKLKESIDSRDTLAKSLYGTAFLKMVELTNGSIGYVKSIDLFCGVLDIFGFECFTYNSFEQLCINFTNERLQQFFNQFIFQCEEMLYKAENITWNKLDFPDNQDCVDLIDRKGNGIFAMLDEECFVPKGSDKAFCNKLIKAHTGNIRFASIKVKQENFVVNHFAGPVSYCSHGFLEKNRDQLSVLMRNCVVTSEDNFVKDCFETFLSRDKRKQQQQHTVSSQFRQQLSHLMETVSQTQPHFIRCVKPNSRNVCEVFERSTVTEQLRYGGVLQAVQVSRAGYPIRISYQEALVDYLPLCTREVKRAINTILDPREKITEMMRHLSDLLSLNTWAVGKTLLFFKRESYEALSSARSRLRIESVIFIQSCWRGVGQRRQFLYTRNAMVKIQCHVRMVLAKRLLKSLRVHHAATRIQSTFRRYVARKYFTSLVASAIHVQNVIRGHEARRRFWQLKTLSVVQKIQNAWRGWKCRSYYNHFRAGVIKTQMHWRGRKAKRVLRQLRAEMRDSVQLGEQNRILKEEIRVLAEKLTLLARSKTETSRLGASSTQSIMLRNVESNFPASTTISSNHHHPRILAESSHNGPNQVSYRLCRSGKVPIFSIFSPSRSVTPNCLVNIPAADEKHNELELLLNRLSLIIMEKPSSDDDSLPAVADVVSVLYHKLHGNLEGFESPTRKKNPVDQIFSSPQTDSTGLDERRSSSSPGSYSATSPAVPLHVFSKIPLCCIFETKPKVVLDDILTSPVNSSSHDSDVLRRLRACSKETSNILDTTDRKIESFYQSDLELLKERKAADVLSTTTSIDVLVFTGESNDEMSMFVSSDNNKTYAITVQGRKLNVVHVPFGGCIEEQHTKLIKKSRRVVIVYDDLRTDSYRSTSMIIKMTTHVHDRICLLQNIKEGGEGPQLKNSLALKDLCSRSNIATFVNRSIADTLTDFLPIRGDFRTSPTSSSSNESSSRQAPRSIGNLVSRIQSFLGKTEKSIILNGRGSTNHGGLEKTLRIGCATTTPSAITCIAFGSEKSNPLYSLMAVSTMDGQILLYRVYRSISETKKYFEDHKQITPPANFSYESCAPDGEEKIVPSVTLCGHSHEITKLMFSEDSSELISTSLDRSVRFWCSQTGGMLKVLTDSNQCLAFACVPKVPNIIIVSNSIPGLRVVDSNNGEVLQRLRPESEIRALCFDDEGTVCFAGSKHGVIHILCPSQPGFRTMSFASKHKVSEEMITSVCCFAGDSSSTPKLIVNTCDSALVILSCISGLDSQRTLRIRGLTILKRIKIPPILFPMKSCVVVAETAASVLSPWQDKMFVAVNLANGSFKPRPFTGHESQVVVVSSNQQGNILASGDATGEICIWRTKSA